MPLIEELPISQSHRITHGWAYVPDTGPGSHAIAAVQPGNRKRGREGATAAATANATAKQQKAAQARLDSLDKENYKDGVTVPIPTRAGVERKRDKKMTANVRRILTYQRGFAHYLADEEANAASTTGQSTTQQTPAQAKKEDGRRKSSAVTETPISTPTPRRGRPPTKDKNKNKNKMPPPEKPTIKHGEIDNDTEMTDAPPPASTQSQPSTPAPPTTTTPSAPKPNYDAKLDAHPLLRTTNLPKMPSDRVMALLVSEPPLSYVAARAKMQEGEEKPVRRFCAICGYWGKMKCRKCGEWTCGILECYSGHQGVCVAQGMF